MLEYSNSKDRGKLAAAAAQNIKERDYWLNQLSGDLVKSSFPYDYKKSDTHRGDFAEVKFKLTGELFSRLQWLSSDSDYTLHVYLTAALVVLLHKYSRNMDILLGTPIYKQDIEGDFINTVLVLRSRLQENTTFKELLTQLSKTIVEAVENQIYPIEILAEQLNMPVSGNDFSLFDVAISLENIHDKGYLKHIHNNLTFSFLREGEQIEGVVQYNPSKYGKETVERIVTHCKNLLQETLFNVDTPLSAVDILSEAEKKQLLIEFNSEETDFPRDKTVHQLFEEQVEIGPDHTATVFRDQHLTYKLLNEETNRLARVLMEKGAVAGGIIGIMFRKSLEMIRAILGVLKAGCGYLPLDIEMPKNRIISMLEDCQAAILLTHSQMFLHHSFTALQGLQVSNTTPHLTPLRPQVDDFDSLPIPDRSLVNYEKYHQYIGVAMAKHTVSIMGTRGCPYNCAYCHKIWPKRHVTRSAENIFEEIRNCYNAGVKRFVFIDDIFNLNRKNSGQLFQMIIDHGLDLQMFFPNGVRGDILTGDYIDLMFEAGTVNLMMALETASPRLQKLLGKNLDIRRFEENLRYIIKNYPDVILEMNIMHGFPTETKEEALMSLDFVKRNQWIHFPNMNILKIYPNTDMEKFALQHGICREAIEHSASFAYHELPDTLPFDKNFTLKIQTELFDEYFMSKQRFLSVLPSQMKLLTENEIVQKYDSYLPVSIKRFSDLLDFIGISRDQLSIKECLDEKHVAAPGFREKMSKYSLVPQESESAFRIFLLDVSQFFSSSESMLYDVVEAPLGLIYLLTYLNREFGSKIKGKVVKSRMDFDSYEQLKQMLEEFKPDLIGMRSLSFHRNFFHQTAAMIRHWGIDVPIIAGGPYATSDYQIVLQDRNIDLVVMGEGEVTFSEVIGKTIDNGGILPDDEVLKEIPGIAFIPGKTGIQGQRAREILMLERLSAQLAKKSGSNTDPTVPSSAPIYTMFTSGSTGKPKGILTQHYNVSRVVKNTNYIRIKAEDKILQLSHYAFDGSVFDIYGALLNGATLVGIEKEEVFSADRLSHLLKREGITVFFLTTALFNTLVEVQLESFKNIRKVLFGGEMVSTWHTKRALDYLGKDRIIHVYGPTETTVFATYYPVNRIHEALGTIPIGSPISNTTVYILDNHLKLVPINGCGEIYIGGAGLAREYLNNPQLTREKFIPSPYCQEERLYRTGDLGRRLGDGNILFLGRIDNQVKIRGFRIEIGEIENLLLKYNQIKDAVVTVREEEDKYLCAYFVSDQEIEISQLKRHLSRELPAFMVPLYFVPMKQLPLNPNGKIDREALPAPIPGTGGMVRVYAEPTNQGEKRLAEMWQQILAVEKVGINDDFFELGGHSLKVIKLINMIRKEFNVKINFQDLFQFPTIVQLHNIIRESKTTAHEEIKTQPKKDYYQLSYTQKRLWILYRMEPQSAAFNMTGYITLHEKVDMEIIKKVFHCLVSRHDSFRTFFGEIDGQGFQRIQPVNQSHINLEVTDLSHLDEKQLEMKKQNYHQLETSASFTLEKAPLFRVKLLKCREDRFHLLFTMHHIISDGWSMDILEHEFFLLYESYKNGTGDEHEPFRIQYKDYVAWHNSLLADNNKVEAAKEFWRNQLSGTLPRLDLPYDQEEYLLESKESAEYRTVVPEEITNQLRKVAREHNASLFMVMLAAFNLLLSRLSGQDDILVAVPGAGRQHDDLQKIIGFFVNTLILRTKINPNQSFSAFLEKTQTDTVQVLEYQTYPLELIFGELKMKYPEISVFFNMSLFGSKERELLEDFQSYHQEQAQTAKFDIVCYLSEYKNSIEILTNYFKKLFKPSSIEKIIDIYTRMLKDISRDPGQLIKGFTTSKKRKITILNKTSKNQTI